MQHLGGQSLITECSRSSAFRSGGGLLLLMDALECLLQGWGVQLPSATRTLAKTCLTINSVTLGKSHFACARSKVKELKNKRNILKNKYSESKYSCKFLLLERKKWEKKYKFSYAPKVAVLFHHPPFPLLSKQKWTVHPREHPLQTTCLHGISVKFNPLEWKKLVLLGFGSACHAPGSCFTPKANMPVQGCWAGPSTLT